MFKALKWLFFDAPLGITNDKNEERKCSYCGSVDNHKCYYEQADYALCYHCLKKIADKILKEV